LEDGPAVYGVVNMDHDTRVRVLKQIVDEAVVRLATGGMTCSEAQGEVERVRNQAKLLIPELMETYDLIYASRLRRIIEQFVEPEHIGR
jgi:hypothetical protein